MSDRVYRQVLSPFLNYKAKKLSVLHYFNALKLSDVVKKSSHYGAWIIGYMKSTSLSYYIY